MRKESGPESTNPHITNPGIHNPDITNPGIELPPRQTPPSGNPLEELLEHDPAFEQLRSTLVGRVIEYGGLRLRVDDVEQNLTVLGKRLEGGAPEERIVIQGKDVGDFRIVE